jgi:hypothetical protein
VWVDVAEVECGVCQVSIRKGDEHRSCELLASNVLHTKLKSFAPLTIDSWVSLICRDIRLDGLTIIQSVAYSDIGQRRVSDVQLTNPDNKFWGSSIGRSDIAVIWSNGLARVLPLKVDLSARVRQRNRSVLRDRSRAVKSSDIVADARLSCGRVRAWSSWAEAGCLIQTSLGSIATGAVGLVENS